jgi:hypothetical protein
MRTCGTVFTLLVVLGIFPAVHAQTPAPARPAAPKTIATSAVAPPLYANLGQLMKGILFPAANVIFAAQDVNPKDVPKAPDASLATNPLASSYGGWEAVENSSLAIAEAANLIILPGRKCSNGRDVPIHNADWPRFVQGLRDAAMVFYKAAQSKNQDNILMAADTLTTACANCHNEYREKPKLEDRCK